MNGVMQTTQSEGYREFNKEKVHAWVLIDDWDHAGVRVGKVFTPG